MARDNELVIKINGDIKGYKDALKKATKETEDLQKTLNTIAKTGAVAFTGLVSVMALSVSRFAEFDNGLRGVKTLLDESSFSAKSLDEGFQDLSKGALKALQDFPLTLESINKSLFDIVSAGIPAANAIDVLGSTSRLAVAGITSSAIATDAVTTALNAYGLGAEQAELVSAKFFTAQKFGKTTIAELSKFMGEAVSSAASFGISLDELLASTAAATSGGIKTSQAFTSLTAILSNIARPTEDAKDESERLGITFNSTAIRAKGLTKFLDDLTKSEGFNAQSAEKLFGSTEALKVVYALTGSGAEKYKETLDALLDSQQVLITFTEAYQTQNESLKNQTIILKNNFDALAIAVGSNFAPTVKILADTMTGFLQFLQDNPALVSFTSKILVLGTVTAGLTTIIALGGLGLLKYRAAMIASAVATTGMSFATKVLIGSTGLGLLVAFLPEIIQFLQGGFVPALLAVTLGLTATALAARKATTSTVALGIAVKGLIGSTGIGLLIVFLPEIIEVLKKFFGDADELANQAGNLQKKRALQQSKDELEINKAKLNGLSAQEIGFIRRAQDVRNKNLEALKITNKEARKIALENARTLQTQLFKDQKKFEKDKLAAATESGKSGLDISQKITDTKLEQLKNENERIAQSLSGQSKEETAFLKRRQDIQVKTREAEAEKDKNRRSAALENVKLLNTQLLKEEESFSLKQSEIQAKKGEELAKEDAERQQRIQKLIDENEVMRAGQEKLSKEEIGFLERRQELRNQAAAIRETKDSEEQDREIENFLLKKEILKEEEEAFFQEQRDLRAERAELDTAIQLELDELSTEQRRNLQQAELDDLIKSFENKEKIRSKAVKKELLATRKENAIFEADAEKHGLIIANFKAFMRTEEFKNAQTAASALSQLQRSENASLKVIGKAAALVQIGIATNRGAIAAYSALAGIPIVGPGLGIAAAAALTAFGIERAAKVQGAQAGGIVAGAGFGDRIPFLLEPGELITPRSSFNEVINAVADKRAVEKEAADEEEEIEESAQEIIIGFDGEEAADVLTVRQNEQRFLGTSQAI